MDFYQLFIDHVWCQGLVGVVLALVVIKIMCVLNEPRRFD